MKFVAALVLMLCPFGAVFAQSLPLPPAEYPIAGSGSGGATGPISPLSPRSSPGTTVAPTPLVFPSRPTPLAPAALEVSSSTADFNETNLSALASPMVENSINSSFTTFATIDVNGATDGSNILTADGTGNIDVYGLTGSLLSSCSQYSLLVCPTVCNSQGQCGAGQAVDTRAIYDLGSQRWVLSALCAFQPSNTTVQDVIGVSTSNNPIGCTSASWHVYNFPACGSFDNWDGSDQPHIGFNNQWLAVTSACSENSTTHQNGTSLAVFDKSNLYNGGSLTLNGNWFEFVDPYNGGPYNGYSVVGARDNPVLTYTSTTSNRLYLTTALVNSSNDVAITYSHVQGSTDSPVFYSNTEKVTTSLTAKGAQGYEIPNVSAPGCTGCMVSFSNGWIHSSGVWAFTNGTPYILSTVVFGEPGFSHATEILGMATNTSDGSSTSVSLKGGTNGNGSMASEIAMPGQLSSIDEALIVYAHSNTNFYPGVKAALWNIDSNSISYIDVLAEGVLSPSNGDQNRWLDFISAITPIPGASSLELAGLVATSSTNDPQRAVYWANLTP